jgi:hypothetical protein
MQPFCIHPQARAPPVPGLRELLLGKIGEQCPLDALHACQVLKHLIVRLNSDRDSIPWSASAIRLPGHH